ncbi:MAG: hypothetical protein Q4B13_01810 [Lautropia sp.]|nr:hypothetical protein [Lautropia sp.]
MSPSLAYFQHNLPELAEHSAHGVLLLLVLALGFILAWFIQALRRDRTVQRLIQLRIEQQQADLTESRLLAEDLALEQANRIAQQARSIEHLKSRLAAHIQRASRNDRPNAPQPDKTASSPPGVHVRTVSERAKSSAPETAPHCLHPTGTGNVLTTAELARRAAARTCARQATATAGPATHRTPFTQTSSPTPVSARRCVDAATRAALSASRAARLHHATQVSRASYALYETTRAIDINHRLAMATFEVNALKKRLAQEILNGREKARLIRQYEQDTETLRQTLNKSATHRVSQRIAIQTLEQVLQQTRQSWAISESQLTQLRMYIQQQPVQRRFPDPLADDHTASLLTDSQGHNNIPPLATLLRGQLQQTPQPLGGRSIPMLRENPPKHH